MAGYSHSQVLSPNMLTVVWSDLVLPCACLMAMGAFQSRIQVWSWPVRLGSRDHPHTRSMPGWPWNCIVASLHVLRGLIWCCLRLVLVSWPWDAYHCALGHGRSSDHPHTRSQQDGCIVPSLIMLRGLVWCCDVLVSWPQYASYPALGQAGGLLGVIWPPLPQIYAWMALKLHTF